MNSMPRPLRIGQNHEIFAVYHAPRSAPRGAVLVCPPLAHELVNSYRLMHLIACWLAEHGLACLRPDYHGTGDSAGADCLFSVSDALADIDEAVAELRAISGCQSIVLMGARAGALIAAEVAARQSDIAGLWLWQPIPSGVAWLNLLAKLDLEIRSSSKFFRRTPPFPRPPVEGDLMGTTMTEQLRDELEKMPSPVERVSPRQNCVVIDTEPLPLADRFIKLPAQIANWTDTVNLRGAFMTPALDEVLKTLLNSDFESLKMPA